MAVKPGQQRRECGELVFIGVAGESRIGKVVGDLLQAQDVEIGELFRRGDDPRRVDAAIDTPAPLHIPRDQYHGSLSYRMPARMKLWTNCRWNKRNATSSGAAVSSVAAVMIDQSIP
jgi:hypothetical protein